MKKISSILATSFLKIIFCFPIISPQQGFAFEAKKLLGNYLTPEGHVVSLLRDNGELSGKAVLSDGKTVLDIAGKNITKGILDVKVQDAAGMVIENSVLVKSLRREKTAKGYQDYVLWTQGEKEQEDNKIISSLYGFLAAEDTDLNGFRAIDELPVDTHVKARQSAASYFAGRGIKFNSDDETALSFYKDENNSFEVTFNPKEAAKIATFTNYSGNDPAKAFKNAGIDIATFGPSVAVASIDQNSLNEILASKETSFGQNAAFTPNISFIPRQRPLHRQITSSKNSAFMRVINGTENEKNAFVSSMFSNNANIVCHYHSAPTNDFSMACEHHSHRYKIGIGQVGAWMLTHLEFFVRQATANTINYLVVPNSMVALRAKISEHSKLGPGSYTSPGKYSEFFDHQNFFADEIAHRIQILAR